MFGSAFLRKADRVIGISAVFLSQSKCTIQMSFQINRKRLMIPFTNGIRLPDPQRIIVAEAAISQTAENVSSLSGSTTGRRSENDQGTGATDIFHSPAVGDPPA
jgi:hypothetical protein